jgi:mevalonate kinase
MVKVSVPGKVHLIGEHAVVYGEPAIITAVGRRVTVEVEKSDKVKLLFRFDDSGVYEDEESVENVKQIGRKALRLWEEGSEKNDFSDIFAFAKGNKFGWVSVGYLMEKLGIDSGVSVNIDQKIPLRSGLGSSSAYSVAIAMAISKLFGKEDSIEKINQLGFELERFKHGRPSGGDNSACAYGGLVWFQKGDPNTIKSLRDDVPYELDNFVLVYIKKPEKTTGELVSHVRGLDPELRDPKIKAIGKATHEMLEALKAKDFQKVKELINLAWDNLSGLGLSVPEADGLIRKIREIGGAAKLCGACGGGIMLCYHEDQERLSEIIREFGYKPMEVELNVEGARVEG